MRHSWRWLWLLTPLSCGYSATPIELVIDTLARDTGDVTTLTALGVADPAASDFEDGTLLSTRWQSQRESARTIELFLDLDQRNLPATMRAGTAPAIELLPDEVRIRVVQRRLNGAVALDQQPASSRVTVIARKSEGSRELSAGRFQMSLPDEEGGAYLNIQGTWQSLPAPPGVSDVPGYPPGDYVPPGDAASPGDPALPGDPVGPGDPIQPGDRTGDDDTVVVFDSGCSCPGGDYEEDLPEEEEPDPEPAPEDTGGCDCVDTTGPNEPDPDPTEPDPDVVREDAGCDCVGDPGPDEPTPVEPEPDPTVDDTSSDTGCDCEGDPGPDEPPVEEWSQASVDGAMLASYSDSARPAKPRRTRRRCRRSPLRIGLELSPVVCLYVLSRWRRRRL